MSLKSRNSAFTHHLMLLLLLLAAFFLRAYQLDGQSLRGDEAATVLYSALPINELWELSRVTDPHPPLYYLLLHPWQWLVGESAWAMRFAGVMASTLAVAALYALARCTHRGQGSGVRGQKSVASNQTIRHYGPRTTDHAPYTIHYVLRTIHYLLSTIYYPPSSLLWPLYILLTLTCFYIHYYTAFLIAFQGLFVLLNIRRFWTQKWPWLASQVVIGLLMIPGLLLAYNFVGEAAGGIETLSTPALLRLTFTSLLTGFTLGDTWGLWLSLILAPIWLIGLISLLRRDFVSGSFWALFFAS
ncbi:MAG: glycosyltransferase family 39 protein [Chloroflexi bacterium]|nr:glycosyltransferase family 39 protein [Chloroflexota bacterium]